MGSINFTRAIRAGRVPLTALNFLLGVALAATGHVDGALINFGAALFNVGVMAFQARGSLPVALLRTVTGRKRPDYARIRELEIECGMAEPEPRAVKAGRLDMPPTMTALKLIRVEPKVTGRKPTRIHGDAAAYWAYRNHED